MHARVVALPLLSLNYWGGSSAPGSTKLVAKESLMKASLLAVALLAVACAGPGQVPEQSLTGDEGAAAGPRAGR